MFVCVGRKERAVKHEYGCSACHMVGSQLTCGCNHPLQPVSISSMESRASVQTWLLTTWTTHMQRKSTILGSHNCDYPNEFFSSTTP
jgi:hypothetical protein